MDMLKEQGQALRLDRKACFEAPGKRRRPSLGGSFRPVQTNTATINNISTPATSPTLTAGVPSVSQHTSPLLHVRDKLSGDIFLVDTGSEVSIVMPRPGDREAAVGPKLTAANGSGITTYGKRKRKIKLECGELSWLFIVAKAKNILGADMLRQFGLLPDLQGQRLVSFKSYSIVRGFLRHVPDGERGISMVVELTV